MNREQKRKAKKKLRGRGYTRKATSKKQKSIQKIGPITTYVEEIKEDE